MAGWPLFRLELWHAVTVFAGGWQIARSAIASYGRSRQAIVAPSGWIPMKETAYRTCRAPECGAGGAVIG